MLTIGVDAHKHLLVAVALDAGGQPLEGWQGDNTVAGWDAVRQWASEQAEQRQWGIEGSGNYGRGLAQFLVAQNELVYEVNPRLTAAFRSRNRQRGKNDELDSRAIAQAVRQEGDALPRVYAAEHIAVVSLLTAERADAVADATRVRNRLHQVLYQLDPRYQERWGTLRALATLEALSHLPAPTTGELAATQTATVRRLAGQLLLLEKQIAELAAEIEQQADRHYQALTALCGVGLLMAGMLAGHLGCVDRFSTDAQVASYAGVAPLEASSAGAVRHRLNRSGNRQLNMLIHRIALTQVRCSPEAQTYLARRRAEGKSWREAIRALKRYIVRRIWQMWQHSGPRSMAVQPTPLT